MSTSARRRLPERPARAGRGRERGGAQVIEEHALPPRAIEEVIRLSQRDELTERREDFSLQLRTAADLLKNSMSCATQQLTSNHETALSWICREVKMFAITPLRQQFYFNTRGKQSTISGCIIRSIWIRFFREVRCTPNASEPPSSMLRVNSEASSGTVIV